MTIWLQLHYTNYITPQLQLHYATTTTTVAVHDTTCSSCGRGDHCNHCNHSSKHNSNHLSVNKWIRSAIRDSQQRTSPIGFLFWNFRHRLVRYYWYYYKINNYVFIYIYMYTLRPTWYPLSLRPMWGSSASLGVVPRSLIAWSATKWDR